MVQSLVSNLLKETIKNDMGPTGARLQVYGDVTAGLPLE